MAWVAIGQVAGTSLEKAPYQGVALRDGTVRRKLTVPFGKSGYVIYYSRFQLSGVHVRARASEFTGCQCTSSS
jgi:hypothetical protein